jgi:acyl dehydratase
MLYALGVGAGVNDLQFTTDNSTGIKQRMVPTMPVTLGVDFSVLKQAGRFDWAGLLHAEQEVELLGEIPVEGAATAVTRITQMLDKGKAALVTAETSGTAADGSPLWRSAATLFIRGVGGWGGNRGPSSTVPEPTGTMKTISYQSRPEQALVYRLSGDSNPLHSDPVFAARAGLEKPILHGLCTFGFAGRAVLEVAGPDTRLRSVRARFAAPVWPGDTLNVDVWEDGPGVLAFQVRGRDDRVVLTNGLAHLQ